MGAMRGKAQQVDTIFPSHSYNNNTNNIVYFVHKSTTRCGV